MGGVRELYGTSLALATTAQWLYLDQDWGGDIIVWTNGGIDYDLLLSPRLTAILIWDNSAETYTDYSGRVSAGTFDTDVDIGGIEQTADMLYVCAPLPFAGLHCEKGVAQDVAAALTGYYPADTAGTDDVTWTDLSITDGTDSSGDCLKQDGNITWTMPTVGGTGWCQTTVNGVTGYWVRFVSDAAPLTATATLDAMAAISKFTTYPRFPNGDALKMKVDEFVDQLQVKSASGTPTIYVSKWNYGSGQSPTNP